MHRLLKNALVYCLLAVSCRLAPVGGADIQPFDVIPGWGTAVDPVGDCKFALDGGALSIHVGAGMHDLHPGPQSVNAPLVLQEATGDFTIEVQVLDVTKAAPATITAGARSVFHAGTLVIWQDAKNMIRFDRTDMWREGRAFNTCYFHIFKDGERTVQDNRVIQNRPTHLRLERRNGSVIASFSEDGGQTWQSFPTQTDPLSPKVKVGVAGLNNSSGTPTARFADFQLRK